MTGPPLRKCVWKLTPTGYANVAEEARKAGATAATPGKRDVATESRLQVQVRYQGDARFRVFKLKSRTSEAAQGWHSAQSAGDDDIAPLLEGLRISL